MQNFENSPKSEYKKQIHRVRDSNPVIRNLNPLICNLNLLLTIFCSNFGIFEVLRPKNSYP